MEGELSVIYIASASDIGATAIWRRHLGGIVMWTFAQRAINDAFGKLASRGGQAPLATQRLTTMVSRSPIIASKPRLLRYFAVMAMLLVSATVHAQDTMYDRWEKAMELKPDVLKRKAASGDKYALLELGRRLEGGEGMPVDLEQAARSYARAASDSGGTRMAFVPSGNGSVISVPISQGPSEKGLPVDRAWLARLCTRNSIDVGSCAAILEHKDDDKLSSLFVKAGGRNGANKLPGSADERDGRSSVAPPRSDMLSTSDFVSRHIRYSLAFDECARNLHVPEQIWDFSPESNSGFMRGCILLTLSTGPICPEGYQDELNLILNLENAADRDNIIRRSLDREAKDNRCPKEAVTRSPYTSSLLKAGYHLYKPLPHTASDTPATRYLGDFV